MALQISKISNSGNIFVDEYLVINGKGTKTYNLKGLYSLIKNNGLHKVEIQEKSKSDLEKYITYLETKKEILFSKLSVESKKRKISELFFDIGAY